MEKNRKKHYVRIWYSLPSGSEFVFNGLINEVIGDNGNAIVYPCGIFKQAFGFTLPPHSVISIH